MLQIQDCFNADGSCSSDTLLCTPRPHPSSPALLPPGRGGAAPLPRRPEGRAWGEPAPLPIPEITAEVPSVGPAPARPRGALSRSRVNGGRRSAAAAGLARNPPRWPGAAGALPGAGAQLPGRARPAAGAATLPSGGR